MLKNRNFQNVMPGQKSIFSLFWNRSLYEGWKMHSVFYTCQVWSICNTILGYGTTYRCQNKGISENVMPGQNQYFGCFEINFYIKVGKCILYYKLIKCEAFWKLFLVMKLLIDVKK